MSFSRSICLKDKACQYEMNPPSLFLSGVLGIELETLPVPGVPFVRGVFTVTAAAPGRPLCSRREAPLWFGLGVSCIMERA